MLDTKQHTSSIFIVGRRGEQGWRRQHAMGIDEEDWIYGEEMQMVHEWFGESIATKEKEKKYLKKSIGDQVAETQILRVFCFEGRGRKIETSMTLPKQKWLQH